MTTLGLQTEGIIGKEFEFGAVAFFDLQAGEAGAAIVKPAHETFWGAYAGYFHHPDQHLWEVVWNPQWASPD